MNSKDILWDFISFVLAIIGVLFVVFYIILGDNYEFFSKLAMFLMFPLALAGSVLVFKLRSRRREYKRHREEGAADLTLSIPFAYRTISDVILYSTPLVILVLAMIVKGMPAADDLIEAAAVWLIFYFWQKLIFNRQQ